MRLAVFSDVHANLPALERVLEAIATAVPDLTICLGDLVGYGAQPEEVIERVLEQAGVVIAGNHDVDLVSGCGSAGTNRQALRALDWTRERLGPASLARLEALPWRYRGDGVVAVHGSYLNPHGVTGYVTSTMLEENLEAVLADAERPLLALCGHTHVPLCGWLLPDGLVEPDPRQPIQWPASAKAVLLNPGAVGQPRDGDPRAAWALIDTERRTAEIRRVPYDVEREVASLAEAGLPPELGVRLREGR